MRKLLITMLILTISISVFAQSKHKLKGTITDDSTGETLVGVLVGVKELPQVGAFSDEEGKYELILSHGEYTMTFQLLGYAILEKKVVMSRDRKQDIELTAESFSLNAVEVSAVRRNENVTNIQMGVQKLQIETVNKIPVLLGEKDIMKTIQLLPGVQTAGEGSVGFYVRGGSSDQNLILVDGATVYNPSHLLGFFSTFNSDAVDGMSIYKGSMPAQYGGRLSSTLSVDMREGDMSKYKVTGGIGLISSRITFEGPIQKEKSSFIISGRRTYADVIAKGLGVKQVENSSLYFYDLNAKMTYVLSPKDKLTFSAYYGNDDMTMNKIASMSWGNLVASLRWMHTFNEKMTSNTTFSYSDYRYRAEIDLNVGAKIKSNIRDFNLTQELNFYPNEKNTIRAGVSSVYHTVIPGELSSKDESMFVAEPLDHRYSWENAIYASHQIQLTDRLEANYGVRATSFTVLGGGDFYSYVNHTVVDTMHSKRGDFVKTYWSVEPRVSLAFQLNDESSVKAAYTNMTQNMHLLSGANMSSPSDRWMASSNYIKPERANQVSLGYFRNFDNNMYEFSAEVYYKKMTNQIDFKDGADVFQNNQNIEPELRFGRGRAYGLELFIKKKQGRFTGWAGYTLSRSQKKINEINGGDWYASNQDRRHDFSIVAMYEINKKWSVSGTWVYGSGAPMTFPNGKYYIDGQPVFNFEGRNKYRTPAFHRLDLGATYIIKKKKDFLSELSFGLYNAYGNKNPYMYGFRQNEDDNTKTEAYMVYLFSIVPSISWNFKF